MVNTTIQETAVRDIKNVFHDPKGGPLSLYRWGKSRAIINRHLADVHRPSWVDVAGIYTEREDEMFLGRAAVRRDHCVEEQRARVEIDYGRAGDTKRVDIPMAYQIRFQHRVTHIAYPDDRAIDSVECVDIIGFGY